MRAPATGRWLQSPRLERPHATGAKDAEETELHLREPLRPWRELRKICENRRRKSGRFRISPTRVATALRAVRARATGPWLQSTRGCNQRGNSRNSAPRNSVVTGMNAYPDRASLLPPRKQPFRRAQPPPASPAPAGFAAAAARSAATASSFARKPDPIPPYPSDPSENPSSLAAWAARLAANDDRFAPKLSAADTKPTAAPAKRSLFASPPSTRVGKPARTDRLFVRP